MLRELYIENLAVIEQVTLSFSAGFTVFTGETGAGKSILIDAINLILGQRIGKEMIRTGAQKAHVTAMFEAISEKVEHHLVALGFESDAGTVLISREIFPDGRTQARLMGRPVTVTVLKQIGECLLAVHGQHDNQTLLQSSAHLEMLDAYAGTQCMRRAYHSAYQAFMQLKAHQRQFETSQQEKKRNIEMLTYQINEIKAVSPQIGEEDALVQHLQTMRSADKITQALSGAYLLLKGVEDQTGAVDAVATSGTLLASLVGLDEEIDEISQQLSSVRYEMEDLTEKIDRRLEAVSFDPIALEECEKRLHQLTKLKQKYGNSIEQVLAFCDEATTKLECINQLEEKQQQITAQLKQEKQRVIACATKLTNARKEAAQRFVAQTKAELVFLDMPNIAMELQMEKGKYGAKGCDLVEILFSTNPGEPPRSISKVASGGELSRIMLAIKSTLSENDAIPTLIFDEVDVGVSGQSSQKIGLKLKQVGAHRQVICVTHSAQIAALSQNHFLIQKHNDQHRTFTRVIPLEGEEKILEVARIMSTGELTPLLLANARAMVQEAAGGDAPHTLPPVLEKL